MKAFNFDLFHKQVHEFSQKTLFFIIGAPKSGTTWLQQLINHHPQIYCIGEGLFFEALMPLLKRTLGEHNKAIQTKNQMLYNSDEGFPYFVNNHLYYLFAASVLMILNKDEGKHHPIIGEKTPGNAAHLPLLARIFPEAKFIHIIRDGRDCAVSGWFHIYRDTPEWAKKTYPQFVDYANSFAKNWQKSVRLGYKYVNRNPDRCFELKFEDLHQSPYAVMKSLFTFLGAHGDSDTVNACIERASFRHLSGGRERGNEDTHSHYRKGIIGDWNNHFDATSLQVFMDHAGALLTELGYN
jgi:hypothetical protein